MQTIERRQLLVGDEDRFVVMYRISYVAGLADDPQAAARQAEDQLFERMQQQDNLLRQRLNEVAKSPPTEEREADVRFEVVDLIYERASIELFVVLGVLYSAVKDYDAVRSSLERLATDFDAVIRNVFNLDPPWMVMHRVEASSVSVRDRAGRERTSREGAATAPKNDHNQTRAAQPSVRWDASRWTVLLLLLYLVVSNIALIVLLGWFLYRATAP